VDTVINTILAIPTAIQGSTITTTPTKLSGLALNHRVTLGETSRELGATEDLTQGQTIDRTMG